MIKKFKLTNETKIIGGVLLYRIQYLIDIPSKGITAGDLGGFLETEKNLEHEGTCVVLYDACVLSDSYVRVDATVSQRAVVKRGSVVSHEAKVMGDALIENSSVLNSGIVMNKAQLSDDSAVKGFAILMDNAQVSTRSEIQGYSVIGGNARIHQDVAIDHYARPKAGCNTHIDGTVEISKGAIVVNAVQIRDSAYIEDSELYDEVIVSESARILQKSKLYLFSKVFGKAVVGINSTVKGRVTISGTSVVYKATISDNARITGKSKVTESILENHAYIEDSRIINQSIVSGRAMIKRSVLSGTQANHYCVVEDSVLSGEKIIVSGSAEIHFTQITESNIISMLDSVKLKGVNIEKASKIKFDKKAILIGDENNSIKLRGYDFHFTGSSKVVTSANQEILIESSYVVLEGYAFISGAFHFTSSLLLSDFVVFLNPSVYCLTLDDVLESGDYQFGTSA